MILSLNNLCLLRVCNLITDGMMPTDLRTVSPRIRREIFKVLVHRHHLSNANCLVRMSEILSDDSLCTVDALQRDTDKWYYAQRDNVRGFLQFLDTHFGTVPELADRITTLRLVATGVRDGQSNTVAADGRYVDLLPPDVHTILKIVGRCRYLKHLTFVNEFPLVSDEPHFLAVLANAVRRAGNSGLEILELNYYYDLDGEFRPTDEQKLAFHRLQHLRLERVRLLEVTWSQLLQCCRETLESLVLDTFAVTDGPVIPMQLNALTSFNFDDIKEVLSLKNVTETCAGLKSCHFTLPHDDLNSDNVSATKLLLSSLEDCSIFLSLDLEIRPLLHELVDVAGEKITSMCLHFHSEWTEDAVYRLIVGCPNLHTLEARDSDGEDPTAVFQAFLALVLCNEERARKLIDLDIDSRVPEPLLNQLFKNCVNLKSLRLAHMNFLTDHHIEIWIKHGARPSNIQLKRSSITDYGLKLLISACGSSLKILFVLNCKLADIDSVVQALIHCCPLLEHVEIPGVSERFRDSKRQLSRNFLYRIRIS